MSNELITLLGESNNEELNEKLNAMNVADLAEIIEEMDETDAVKIFQFLDKDMAAEVFAYLNPDTQQYIIESTADREIGDIVNEMFLDDAVDFIEDMPDDVASRVLANIAQDTREMINEFMQYPEDSAGSIMTIEFVELREHQTVPEAFAHIRETGADKETLYTFYVVDDDHKLSGIVSGRTLMLSDRDKTIGEIMEQNVVFAHALDDKETVVNTLIKYGFTTIPIIDDEERLIGIVTYDDAFIVVEEETTEDFEKMAAMSPSEDEYLKSGVFTLAKHRIPWLMFLMVFATLTGELVTLFEDSLAALPILVAFVPMLMNTGGNAGSQSTTLIIRGMALEEIKQHDFLKVMWIETLVSFVCGVILCVGTYISVVILGGDFALSMTVCAAMIATLLLANGIGVILTFGAKVFKVDPAVMAAPLVTNIVDALALVVYFLLAKAILHI